MCKAGDIVFVNLNNAIIKAIIIKKDKDKIYVTNIEKKDNIIYEIEKKRFAISKRRIWNNKHFFNCVVSYRLLFNYYCVYYYAL